jgi:hypothetical protein
MQAPTEHGGHVPATGRTARLNQVPNLFLSGRWAVVWMFLVVVTVADDYSGLTFARFGRIQERLFSLVYCCQCNATVTAQMKTVSL